MENKLTKTEMKLMEYALRQKNFLTKYDIPVPFDIEEEISKATGDSPTNLLQIFIGLAALALTDKMRGLQISGKRDCAEMVLSPAEIGEKLIDFMKLGSFIKEGRVLIVESMSEEEKAELESFKKTRGEVPSSLGESTSEIPKGGKLN